MVKNFPYKVAILLPDTDLEDGQFAIKRIKAMLKDMDQSLTDFFQKIKISIYYYPVQPEEINKFIHNQIVDDKNSATKLERTVEKIKSYYSNKFYRTGVSLAGDESNFQFLAAGSLVNKNPFF